MDKDGDGKLSREELTEAYSKQCDDPQKVKQEVEATMANLDPENDGLVDYHGMDIDYS